MIKRYICSTALVLALSSATLLASCGRNMTGTGTTPESSGETQNIQTEAPTEKKPVEDIIDGAQRGMRKIEDGIEDATHGTMDGTLGGHSTRGNARIPTPRGK